MKYYQQQKERLQEVASKETIETTENNQLGKKWQYFDPGFAPKSNLEFVPQKSHGYVPLLP